MLQNAGTCEYPPTNCNNVVDYKEKTMKTKKIIQGAKQLYDEKRLVQREQIIKSLMPLVRDECTNYISGECIVLGGVLGKQMECLLYKGERCKYFETTVMPLGDPEYRYHILHHVEKYADRINEYKSVILNDDKFAGRTCKICGVPIGRRKKYCEKCRKSRRRNMSRKTSQK
jgi:hypothetical protein